MGLRRPLAGALGVLIVLAAAACGRRGDPLPPRPRGDEAPPRLAFVARAGDRVLARFGEPATAFVVDVAPLGAVACLPDDPQPLATLEWQDAGDGWTAFAAPTTGALGLRVRTADGRRTSGWRTVPAAAASPAAPAVTAATDDEGRVTLWFAAGTTARVEHRPAPDAAWRDLGLREGPRFSGGVWPPGAAPAWRLRGYARTATGAALSARVSELEVRLDDGPP